MDITKKKLEEWRDSLSLEDRKMADAYARYHYELGIDRGYERGRPRDVLDMD